MSVKAGSDPFNSALQRAKEIAAKIQGSEDFIGSDTRKRSFNGEEQPPANKRVMMEGGYMNQGIQGSLKDEIRVPGAVTPFLTGDALQKLQSQTGCHIQIPPPGPDPNAERAIALSGSRQCIENCKQRIRDIIHQHVPEAALGGMHAAQGYGQGNMMEQMAPLETVDMLIPQNKVGLVIGRGGETIKDLAVQSGCKMNMVQDGPYANAPEKPLRMHGTKFAINKARELVSGLIQQEFGNRPPHHQQHNNFNQHNQGPFEDTKNFPVPRDYVGLVIGKNGDTIKKLQSETGAKIQFNCTDANAPGDRYVIIQGTKAQVANAEMRMGELLGKMQNKDFSRGPNQKTVSYPVPANKCGLVIGKKGDTISRMKERTGAHIEMNKNSPHDAPVKQFTIKGTDDQIEAAKAEIAKIVGDDHPYGGGGGGGGYNHGPPGHGMYGGQQPPPAAAQQPMPGAYHQQMAYYQAYYQQQAAMQQAAMQNPVGPGGQGGPMPSSSGAPVPAPTTAAAAAPAPAADQQSVQQQWAAYYQQLVQMYGVEQAQVYWTQLSQQQQQQQ